MNPLYSVTYVHHDCFLIQVPGSASFLFDFAADPAASAGKDPRFLSLCSPDDPLFVIVSHHHKDHFTPEIFRWQKKHPEQGIRYILSRDTEKFARHYLRPESTTKGPKPAPGSVSVLTAGESFTSGQVRVHAFPSTDIGNSYAVTVNVLGRPRPIRFFHAGDLNAWLWKACSTQEEVDRSLRDYSAILAAIAEKYTRFDVAMFPVDARIGPGFETGARMFLENIHVDNFIPMHYTLWENDEERERYLEGAMMFETYATPRCGTCHFMPAPYSRFALFH